MHFRTVSLPPFLLPSRESEAGYGPDATNETILEGADERLSFLDSWSLISTGPLVIALISILQNVAISKAFGSGQKVDATQVRFLIEITLLNILKSHNWNFQ